MNDPNPEVRVGRIEADPKRPWKAVAAALSSVAALVLSLGLDLDPVVLVILTALAAGGGAYVTRSPLVHKDVRPGARRR